MDQHNLEMQFIDEQNKSYPDFGNKFSTYLKQLSKQQATYYTTSIIDIRQWHYYLNYKEIKDHQ